MSSLNNIDIDSFIPNFQESFKRPGYTVPHYDYRPERVHVGVKVETLLDWRSLERRYAAAHNRWQVNCSRYFDTLKNVSKAMVDKGRPGVLWICDTSSRDFGSGTHRYLVYDHRTMSTHFDDHAVMVERGRKNPDYRGSIIIGDDARVIMHMRYIDNRSVRVAAVFRETLFTAIKARLQVYVDSLMSKKGPGGSYHGIDEMIVIIKNDDRYYIVEVDRYGVMKMKYHNVVTTFEAA